MNHATLDRQAESSTTNNQAAPSPHLAVLDAEPVSTRPNSISDLHNLLNNGSYRLKEERALIQRRTVEPATTDAPPAEANPYECIISAPPTATAQLGQRMRNGKIARLPKLERDLVNKLIHNHVPYSKIVWALAGRDITVTERNISNWRTRGGYKEWCAEQENQLRFAHIQDHLTDYLRQRDAQELPEVGLQVASTQLTSLLMNPQTAAALLADPNKYARVVDSLDKCSARLKELQNDRYDTVRRSKIQDTIPNLRAKDASHIENLREIASAEELAKSAYEEDIPHRNHLPPREELPYGPPKLTHAELVDLMQKSRERRKNEAEAQARAAQTTPSGNQTETHANSQ
ncbi:MAG TPA: hypothetical protein VLT36_22115 [Candidatus Dormibacteraeota bacterium]|nr:hypothetical protein [Candidatus Dormibacteraeota bacterium]